MKIHEVEQRSIEWVKLHVGRPSASQFHRIITPTGALSRQSEAYLGQLLAERMLQGPVDDGFQNPWMERGTTYEDQAFAFYELERGVDIQRVGFVTTDDGRVGCSPDGLVGADGGMEMKIPGAGQHVLYMLQQTVPERYKAQVQGSLWICERAWWDFVSYNPELPPVVVRVERDEAYINKLSQAITTFCDMLDECESKLRPTPRRSADADGSA